MLRSPLARARARLDRALATAVRPVGYDLTRRHYYSPIPDVRTLPAGLWDEAAQTPGVDLRVDAALELLQGPLAPYLDEFRPRPAPVPAGEFWLDNGGYQSVDAETLYAMLRHLRPARVFELGSGSSSHVISLAAKRNAVDGWPLNHTIYDPFPYAAGGSMGPVSTATVRAARSEDIDPEPFAAELQDGDVLFVDTTHTVRTGGDVTHIFLQLLPRLAPGVSVHIHDVFLPDEYPREWVVRFRRAWAEQYLLQAFLAFNERFEVVLPNAALARQHPDIVRRLIPSFDPAHVVPGALWMRRVG